MLFHEGFVVVNAIFGKKKSSHVAYLIVNADDYGYSEGVSSGILDAARKGAITAIGILANSPFFDEHVKELLTVDSVDAGVHLNLTEGTPLTKRMAARLERSGGEFTGNKFHMALSILSGRIDVALVAEEWEAQIHRCLDANIQVRFLNSHEHLHMLPPLFRLIHRLADFHHIPFIRYSSAEWFDFPNIGSIPRELVLQILDWINRGTGNRPRPVLIGVSRSGKLDLPYLERKLGTLRRGQVYELMCHPGRSNGSEELDRRLIAYHDWEGELNALLQAEEQGIIHSESVRLLRFRDLNELLG